MTTYFQYTHLPVCQWPVQIYWVRDSRYVKLFFVGFLVDFSKDTKCRVPGLSPAVKYFYWPFQSGSFVLFMSCVCQAFSSVHCCLVVKCWEKADLLALTCDVKLCLSLSHAVSWVRCGTWLHRFLIFVNFLTLEGIFLSLSVFSLWKAVESLQEWFSRNHTLIS